MSVIVLFYGDENASAPVAYNNMHSEHRTRRVRISVHAINTLDLSLLGWAGFLMDENTQKERIFRAIKKAGKLREEDDTFDAVSWN